MAESVARAPRHAKLRTKVVAVSVCEISACSDRCSGECGGSLPQNKVAQISEFLVEWGEIVIPQPEGQSEIWLGLPRILAKKAIGVGAEVLAKVCWHARGWVVGSVTGVREETNTTLVIRGIISKAPEIVEVILRSRLAGRHVRILLLAELSPELQHMGAVNLAQRVAEYVFGLVENTWSKREPSAEFIAAVAGENNIDYGDA